MDINTFNDYLKKRFGHKVYKISLDAGMTCPNRDGTIDTRGCIFCSEGGSGDFATSSRLSISDQISEGISLLGKDSFQEIDIAGVTMPITKYTISLSINQYKI